MPCLLEKYAADNPHDRFDNGWTVANGNRYRFICERADDVGLNRAADFPTDCSLC